MILTKQKKVRVQLLDPSDGKSKTFTVYGTTRKELEKLIKQSVNKES